MAIDFVSNWPLNLVSLRVAVRHVTACSKTTDVNMWRKGTKTAGKAFSKKHFVHKLVLSIYPLLSIQGHYLWKVKGSNVCKIRKQFGRKDTRKRPLASFFLLWNCTLWGRSPSPFSIATCTELIKRDGPLLLTGKPLLKGMWQYIRAKFRCCY